MRLWDLLDFTLPVALVLLVLGGGMPGGASSVLTQVTYHKTMGPDGYMAMGRGSQGAVPAALSPGNATANLSSALNRLVLMVSIAAGAIVTLAWARVALSWFSTDPTKKITAKERARDAALGTFILLSAVTGLAWGLAHWVLTGS